MTGVGVTRAVGHDGGGRDGRARPTQQGLVTLPTDVLRV